MTLKVGQLLTGSFRFNNLIFLFFLNQILITRELLEVQISKEKPKSIISREKAKVYNVRKDMQLHLWLLNDYRNDCVPVHGFFRSLIFTLS